MPKKIDEELKARAVRLVSEYLGEYPSLTAASAAVAKQLGVGKESVRRWVVQAQVDGGQRHGVQHRGGGCLAWPWVALTVSSISTKQTRPASGSSGVCEARLPRNLDATASSCRTWPKENVRKNVPSVEGARRPPKSRPIPP